MSTHDGGKLQGAHHVTKFMCGWWQACAVDLENSYLVKDPVYTGVSQNWVSELTSTLNIKDLSFCWSFCGFYLQLLNMSKIKTSKTQGPQAHTALPSGQWCHYVSQSLWKTHLYTRKRTRAKKESDGLVLLWKWFSVYLLPNYLCIQLHIGILLCVFLLYLLIFSQYVSIFVHKYTSFFSRYAHYFTFWNDYSICTQSITHVHIDYFYFLFNSSKWPKNFLVNWLRYFYKR